MIYDLVIIHIILQAPLQMIQVDTYNTTMHIPDLDESNQYLIGMSYTSKNESSGFVWSDCLIRKNSKYFGFLYKYC